MSTATRRPITAHLGPGADDEAGEGGLQLGADVLGEEGEHGGAAEQYSTVQYSTVQNSKLQYLNTSAQGSRISLAERSAGCQAARAAPSLFLMVG